MKHKGLAEHPRALMKLRTERGAVLVTTAVVLFAMIGIAALAIDIPVAMAERRNAQNAADHAALSAAWAHCESNSPETAATASVVRNGYTAGNLSLDNPATGQYVANVSSSSGTFFGKVFGASDVAVGTSSAAECTNGGGSGTAIFASGKCRSNHAKITIDISGSNQIVWGGIHSNDDIYIGGQNNDLGLGNGAARVDPVTYAVHFAESNPGQNYFDTGWPQKTSSQTGPFSFTLAQFDSSVGGASAATAQADGKYFWVDGNIDGAYIVAHGEGLYYATGNIVMDQTVGTVDDPFEITLVAEGFVSMSGSGQFMEPYIHSLWLYGGQPYTGIDRCDKFVVSVGGSDNSWKGIVYGPDGLLEFNGSGNSELTGSLYGHAVKLDGSQISIIADPSLFLGDPMLRLTE
jgi:hypothetical protein